MAANLTGRSAKSPAERILSNSVLVESGCWEWTGYLNPEGYGSAPLTSGRNARKTTAQRVSYTAFVGPIPDGLVIDHLCKNRKCVNPQHLEAVTQMENIRRSDAGLHMRDKAAKITSCPRGHEYSEANTTWYGNKRKCRTCHRASQARYLAKRAGGAA